MPSSPAAHLDLEQTALTATGGGTVLRLTPSSDGTWRALVIARGGRPVAVDLDPEVGTAVVFPRSAVRELAAAA